MPYIVVRDENACPASKPWAVMTETTHGSGVPKGRPHGCHPSKAAALKQSAALYVNVPEAKSEIETGPTEVPMSTTASPVLLTPHTIEWRRERARALSETQRKRPETRQVHEPLELREETDDGKRTLRSYASLFNDAYMVRAAGYKFEEVVRPGAFKRTLGTSPDVVFRTEHSGPPLAATWSGDLRLGEDQRGLWYEVDLDTSDPDVQSLIAKVNRGVYRESSFAFRIPKDGDRWNEDHDRREVLACELDRGDVSVVTFGASRETGKHMLLRSEEDAIQALQELGFQRFIDVFREWRDFTLLPPEERIGKVISSQSMECLRQVLGLLSDGTEAVNEAEAMLADFISIPSPDGSASRTAAETTEKPDSEEAERAAPTMEDYGVMSSLKEANLALAHVKAKQLADPDHDKDPDDKAVMTHITAAQSEIEQAIVAQGKDGRPDAEKGSGSEEAARGASAEEAVAAETSEEVEAGSEAEDGSKEDQGDIVVETSANGQTTVTLTGDGLAQQIVHDALVRAREAVKAEDAAAEQETEGVRAADKDYWEVIRGLASEVDWEVKQDDAGGFQVYRVEKEEAPEEVEASASTETEVEVEETASEAASEVARTATPLLENDTEDLLGELRLRNAP